MTTISDSLRSALTRMALAASAVLVVAAQADAQTPVTSLGLGTPVPAVDARTASLGGAGIALLGGSVSARNPADISWFGRPVMGITYAPETVSVKGGTGDGDTGRSRISVLKGSVPYRDWTFGLSFAAELDQDWEVAFADTLVSAEGTFPLSEVRTNDGGVSSVNFALAKKLGRLSVGAEYGLIVGSLRQGYRRDFGPDVDDQSIRPLSSSSSAEWHYSGSRFRAGATAQLTSSIRIGGDVSLQTDMTAERDSIAGTTRTRRFDMPAAFELGGSARVSERLLVTAGGGWTGWSGSEGGSTGYVASDVIWGGLGAEFTGTRLLGVDVPLRAGVRRTDLPFHAPGADQLSETAVTLGFGVRVAEEQARFDFAVELGSRGDVTNSGVEESFQRVSLSLALFQR